MLPFDSFETKTIFFIVMYTTMFQTVIAHTGTFVLSFVCVAAIAKIAHDATQLLKRRRQLQELKELTEETKAIKREIDMRPRNCCVNDEDEDEDEDEC